jgi:hypothetical protein
LQLNPWRSRQETGEFMHLHATSIVFIIRIDDISPQFFLLVENRNSNSPVERRKNDIAHGLKIGIGATRDYNLIGVVCQSGFKISSNLTTHIHENKSQRTLQPFKTIPIQYIIITPAGAHLREQSEHVNYLLVKIHQFNWILTK